ncbi:helix-turn-helix domain-containing protein [Rosenbergiella australiborealis]|uniref:helix-turn-helix domain-containing protein n=1 Tax=Rosenbergiella australiborealis TaxID=1544696 RepID=UPI001F4E36C2|nr:helix-turn-helix transcriptional regulator [Rosenbergiella australiborealis]
MIRAGTEKCPFFYCKILSPKLSPKFFPKGLTLKAVSKASGIDVGNLSRIERVLQVTSLSNAKKLSKFFGGEVSEIEILFPFN